MFSRPKLDEVGLVSAVVLAGATFAFGQPEAAVVCFFISFVLAVVLWTPARGWLGIPPSRREQPSQGENAAFLAQIEDLVNEGIDLLDGMPDEPQRDPKTGAYPLVPSAESQRAADAFVHRARELLRVNNRPTLLHDFTATLNAELRTGTEASKAGATPISVAGRVKQFARRTHAPPRVTVEATLTALAKVRESVEGFQPTNRPRLRFGDPEIGPHGDLGAFVRVPVINDPGRRTSTATGVFARIQVEAPDGSVLVPEGEHARWAEKSDARAIDIEPNGLPHLLDTVAYELDGAGQLWLLDQTRTNGVQAVWEKSDRRTHPERQGAIVRVHVEGTGISPLRRALRVYPGNSPRVAWLDESVPLTSSAQGREQAWLGRETLRMAGTLNNFLHRMAMDAPELLPGAPEMSGGDDESDGLIMQEYADELGGWAEAQAAYLLEMERYQEKVKDAFEYDHAVEVFKVMEALRAEGYIEAVEVNRLSYPNTSMDIGRVARRLSEVGRRLEGLA